MRTPDETQLIPAKTDQPNEPLYDLRNPHSYSAGPSRGAKKPIPVASAANVVPLRAALPGMKAGAETPSTLYMSEIA